MATKHAIREEEKEEELRKPLLGGEEREIGKGATTLYVRRDLDERRIMFMFAMCEMIGAFFVSLFAIGSVVAAGTMTYQFKFSELSTGRLLAVGLANGMGYGAVLYALRSLSRPFCCSHIVKHRRGQSHYMLRFPVGHCNPIVTFAVCLVGDISALLALIYIGAQFVGSLAAAYFIYYVVPNAENTEMGTTLPGLGASDAQAFGMEMFASFALVFTLLHFFVSSIQKAQDSANGDVRKGPAVFEHFAPFAAGLVVTALTLLSALISGASTNPLRSFASALTADVWTSQWIYVVAPVCGSLLAAFLARIMSDFSA